MKCDSFLRNTRATEEVKVRKGERERERNRVVGGRGGGPATAHGRGGGRRRGEESGAFL